MTFPREQIIEWANESSLGTVLSHGHEERVWIEGADWHDELMNFAALIEQAARADEREACVKLCDDIEVERTDYCMHIYEEGDQYKRDVIAAIRARSDQ